MKAVELVSKIDRLIKAKLIDEETDVLVYNDQTVLQSEILDVEIQDDLITCERKVLGIVFRDA